MILNFASDIQRCSIPTGFVYKGQTLIWERLQLDQLAQPPEIGEREIAVFELDESDNYTGTKLYSSSSTYGYVAQDGARDYVRNNTDKRCVIVVGTNANIGFYEPGSTQGSNELINFTSMSNLIGFFCRKTDTINIRANCFAGCGNLKTAQFNKVYWMYRYAFAGCSALKYFKMPAYIRRIDQGCFTGSGLVKIDMYECGQGNDIIDIYSDVFSGADLRDFYFPPGLRPYMGDSYYPEAKTLFSGCMNLSVIYVDQVYAPDIYHSPWQANAPWGAVNARVIYREAE